MLYKLLWLKSPNAVYLRGNCQLHSGLSYDKKSLVSVSVETRNFEAKIFLIFVYEKMLIIQFHSMEKLLITQFHLWKKCLFFYFHTLTFAL